MRTWHMLLLALIAGVLLAACDGNIETNDGSFGDSRDDTITGSGQIEERVLDLAGFDRLQIGSAFEVEVTIGEDFEVIVQADDNLFDILRLEVRDGRLTLGVHNSIDLYNATLTAQVTAPKWIEVESTGSSRLDLNGLWSGDDLTLKVFGASSFDGAIEASSLDLQIRGASEVEIRGAVVRLQLILSGASRLRAYDLDAGQVEVDMSGASSAELSVSGAIGRASLSGASSLRYDGDPTLRSVATSGASVLAPR